MALNVAINGSTKALELRSEIVFDDVATPDGRGKSVSEDNLASLYAFFEQCMIAITFSFQALETFANQQIGTKLQGKIRLKRKKETKEYGSEEIERLFSTDEKLGKVLPQLLKIPTLQGTEIWNKFIELKVFRDSCIHLKTKDQYSAHSTEGDLFYYKLLNADIKSIPGISMHREFSDTSAFAPRRHLESALAGRCSAAAPGWRWQGVASRCHPR